ncbi:flagellin N-terminal helical domain-containing protein [Microbacterium aerolatum]|uniref:Flagellin n=1 Tax=Microbacterium aerolatum TaxID=153731 RepID=A0A511AFJ4_9MICO|nr:flagellin [Microbacterium aerolatum]GEK86928.1 flagellin [Microbacterium aerolatum]GGB15840.1 flagellin [Microbacterium aerolatum]
MGMQINTNVSALNAYRNLSNTQNDLSKSLEKLSSGLRINRAADDAAGLAISEGLRSQVNGLNVAARNAQDGISVIQTAEGALTEVHSILQRVRDLAVQAGNDSNNTESRTAIQTEVTQLAEELTRISTSTNFNGIDLLTGATAGDGTGQLTFQVGAGGVAANDQIAVDLTGADVGAVATAVAGLTFDTAANAAASITALDTQITSISSARAELGAAQNRFESTINSLNVSAENLSAAESRIRDTDMAAEMVKYTAANILSQAGTAMLAQANQSTQGVLQLLR